MRIPIKGLGDVGYIADQDSYELVPNAITELQNFRTQNGWLERVRGHRQIGSDMTFTPYFLTQYSTTDTKYIVRAGLRVIDVYDGSTATDISGTPPTMLASHRWTGGDFFGNLVLNSGADIPQYWNGSLASNLANLTGWDSTYRAKFIAFFERHIFAGNITISGANKPNRLIWSNAAEPGSIPADWNISSATSDANAVDIPGEGSLVDAIPLGDALIVYKDRSMSAIRYQPSNTSVFRVDPLPHNVGMLATGCGANVPGVGHVVLTKGDVIVFDGNSVASVIDGKAKEWLVSNIDENYSYASFVTHNAQKSEVWVCFPEQGYNVCTKALVWNYRTKTLSKRDLPNVTCATQAIFAYAVDTYDTDSVSFDSESVLTFDSGTESVTINDARLFMGTSANELMLMDSGDSADGSSFTAYIERTGLNDLGGMEDRVKLLTRLWLSVDGDSGAQISVYFGSSNDPSTAPTYQSAQTYTVGTSQYVTAITCGRYLAIKLSATGTAFWRVRSMTLEVEDAGQY